MKVVFGPNAYALSGWMLTLRNEQVHRVSGRDPDFGMLSDYLDRYQNSPIDVVCAAVMTQNSLLVNDVATHDQITSNIDHYVALTRIVLPHMIRAKYGRFVYLSSIRSLVPAKGAVLYGACKAFGEQLFAGIGVEYERFNIRTTSLRLGYLDGGLAGPRPEGELLTPKQVTATIDYAMHVMETRSTILDLDGGQPYV